MEESISGGRRVKNARPTINSYMFGNAKALAEMAELAGKSDLSGLYRAKDSVSLLTAKRLEEVKSLNALNAV